MFKNSKPASIRHLVALYAKKDDEEPLLKFIKVQEDNGNITFDKKYCSGLIEWFQILKAFLFGSSSLSDHLGD